MNILHLAPHPFYQERGTPIDVLLVLRVLTARKNTKVDLLVYNEGSEINLQNLIINRIPSSKFNQNIRPGFSLKKLVCDVQMSFKAWSMVKRNKYDLIHAGEEAVFFAMFFNFCYKIPYAYDLDSSIAQQLVEKKPILKCLSFFFSWLEGQAIKKSVINFPVCNALAELCAQNASSKTVTLHDISQLKNPNAPKTDKLKKELGIDKLFILYIGNLEAYQGIDLLIESFQLTTEKSNLVDLVIIGGVAEDIEKYKRKTHQLGIDTHVHFLGPKPFEDLDLYLAEADILACPRIRGVNTPMKIFPYLHSGKPVLATDLYTHNQLLTSDEVYLAPPTSEGFSKGMIELVENESLRKKIGKMDGILSKKIIPLKPIRIASQVPTIGLKRLSKEVIEKYPKIKHESKFEENLCFFYVYICTDLILI